MKRNSGGRLFKRKSRLTKKTLPTWHMGWYERGNPREVTKSTGTTSRAEAKEILRTHLGEVANGKGKRRRLAGHLTVQDALAHLQHKREKDGRTLPLGHVQAWRNALGPWRLVDLTEDDIDHVLGQWRTTGVQWAERTGWRVRPVTGPTCNRYVATLRRAINLLTRKHRFTLDLTYPSSDENARDVYIPPSHFLAILEHIENETARDVFDLMYRTSVRKGQWQVLEKGNIVTDGDKVPDAIFWRGDQTKNDDHHSLALGGRAKDIIARHWRAREVRCPNLLHGPQCPRVRLAADGSRRPCLGESVLRNAWLRGSIAAGFATQVTDRHGKKRWKPVYRMHDCRHGGITNFSHAGVPDVMGMSMSGHKDVSQYKRYSHPQHDSQRRAAEMADAYIASQAGRPTTVTPLHRAS